MSQFPSLKKILPLNEQRMPLSYRLLDRLHPAVPVVICFAGSSFPQSGLPDKLPTAGMYFVNGDEDSTVPHYRLRKVEEESLIENCD